MTTYGANPMRRGYGFGRLHTGSPPLTAVGLLMAGMLVVFAVGLVFDHRLVLGAPVWLKPAKFAASTSLYAFTTAWILSFLQPWSRLRRAVGGTIAGVFLLEVGLIAFQAARGTTSHFNLATPFDAVVFSVMGAAILIASVLTLALTVAAFRHRFEDESLGWAIRLGLAISLAGSMVGGLMVRPTSAQLQAATRGARPTVAGAHTIGAADGGPGIPGMGWSLQHGDLRVPHFVGIHALQTIPLVAVATGRRLGRRRRTRVVFVAAGAHAVLFAILLGQALGGESFFAPGRGTLAAQAAWALVTVTAAALVLRAGHMGDTQDRAARCIHGGPINDA